jgi:hypothetical protein
MFGFPKWIIIALALPNMCKKTWRSAVIPGLWQFVLVHLDGRKHWPSLLPVVFYASQSRIITVYEYFILLSVLIIGPLLPKIILQYDSRVTHLSRRSFYSLESEVTLLVQDVDRKRPYFAFDFHGGVPGSWTYTRVHKTLRSGYVLFCNHQSFYLCYLAPWRECLRNV